MLFQYFSSQNAKKGEKTRKLKQNSAKNGSIVLFPEKNMFSDNPDCLLFSATAAIVAV